MSSAAVISLQAVRGLRQMARTSDAIFDLPIDAVQSLCTRANVPYY
jgi:hypothetical protein